MRALVVGCGYVGLPLGAELARRGHQVFGLRRSSEANSQSRLTGIAPLIADITRFESLAALPKGFDWVVNCSGTGGGGLVEYQQLYLEGTRNLLNWLSASPPQKFVYTSSTAVYGQRDGSLVDESSPTTPESETARVLVETENLLLSAARAKKFPAVILRVAGIYGPGRGHLLKQFMKGEARIEGNGDRMLNMIHLNDLINIVIAGLEGGRPGEIYNAADNEPVRQRAFFEWLAVRLKKELPPPARDISPQNRKRGVTNKRVSNQKLRSEFKYEFSFPTFREGYEAELKWLQNGKTLEPNQ